MDNKQTKAHQIATLFGNDGRTFETEDGRDIFDVLEAACLEKDQNWDRGATRFTFDDDSAITVAGPAWDIGFKTCFCWEGAGHNEDTCEAKQES